MGSNDSSSPLVVEKSEVVLVKPSKPTPEVSLSLSTLDNEPYLENIVQTICVFAPKDEGKYDLASLLQYALSAALSYYYPLAGKVHRKSDDNRHQLNCKAGDGVPLIKATAACTLESVNYVDSAGDAAYQLVPCYDTVKSSEGYDPLALQLTKFACGGITIGITYYHSVCDGSGVAQFIRAMMELAGGMPKPSVIPVWDRERLTFNGKLEDVVEFPEGGSSTATSSFTLSGEMVREVLNISSEDIAKLKKTIAEEITDEEEKKVVVTTMEILTAHVWRARCRALNMGPDDTTVLNIAINIRNSVEPPLPEGYYGNAVIRGLVGLKAKELRELSLSHVVKVIKHMKAAAQDKQYVLGYISEIERRLNVKASVEGIDGGFMMLSDWRQIGLQYNGFGGLVNIIPLIPMSTPFICILLPASKAVPEMAGGVRVLVTLPKDAMEKFKEEMKAF